MKKAVSVLTILAALSMLITGCGGKTEVKKIQEPGLAKEFANAPKWVLNPAMEKTLCAAGSAKVGPAGMQFARTEALANGRDELARIISVKVKNLVSNFAGATGIGDDQTVDKVSKQVSKQVASQTLNGSRQKDLWVSPGGDVYILVVIDPEVVKEAVKNSVQTSYKNEQALWQQFQAKKGHEELDKEIEKEFGEFKGQ